MKMLTKTLAVLCVVTFLASTAFAIEGGNPIKGKYLARKDCKACHTAGHPGGAMTPMSKTMAQWDRWFKEDAAKHPGAVFTKLSKKDLLDIHQFFYDHGADSPQPATCG
ncbi:MAG TPA: cytochrome c [Desulfuromonadales bacterium]|nr:cytochrome c [Desulfuromonadales bacterium]